jgi:hypothetical protein
VAGSAVTFPISICRHAPAENFKIKNFVSREPEMGDFDRFDSLAVDNDLDQKWPAAMK